MNYSLYILFGNDDKGKAGEFMGNTDLKTHLAASAVDAVSSAVGFDVWDTYANKLSHENSVALTDNITEMTFTTAVGVMAKYQKIAGVGGNLETFEDIASKYLKHTLTVKGNLEYPKILFKMGVETAKKKDTSRIWKWANTPLGIAKSDTADIKALYYRDVVATVFSTDDRQFRAIHIKDASVGSYEEYYDKNGEGHFTLVITKMVEMPQAAQQGAQAPPPEISAKGPEFDGWKFTQVMGDISKAAKTAGKLTEDAANVTEKIVGKDNEYVKKMHKAAEGMDKGGDDIQKTFVDGSAFNPDELSKEIDDHAKYGRDVKHLHDGDTDDGETQSTDVKYLPDGSTETTVTVINDDGSKDITTTTKDKKGNEKVKKQHEEPKGYKDW